MLRRLLLTLPPILLCFSVALAQAPQPSGAATSATQQPAATSVWPPIPSQTPTAQQPQTQTPATASTWPPTQSQTQTAPAVRPTPLPNAAPQSRQSPAAQQAAPQTQTNAQQSQTQTPAAASTWPPTQSQTQAAPQSGSSAPSAPAGSGHYLPPMPPRAAPGSSAPGSAGFGAPGQGAGRPAPGSSAEPGGFEVRSLSEDNDGDGVDDTRDYCPGTPRGAGVDERGCPRDGDGDGVPDYLDKCPATVTEVPVGPDGCPLDTDRDGVPDYKDKCPDTPAGVRVAPDGCPPDADHDGVADAVDRCPSTNPEYLVDEGGCPIPLSYTLDVVFDSGKADLKPIYKQNLLEFALIANQYPEHAVIIEGYTDNLGDPARNKELSQQRADAVAEVLIKEMNVAGNRVTSIGYGDEKPVADNATPEGRLLNRRVEGVIEGVYLRK